MKDSSRRSFVKTSAATGLTFTFAGLIRAHGQSGGGNTTWNPEGTFFSTNSGETTTYDPNGTYVTTESGVTTTWDPDATTVPETATTTEPETTASQVWKKRKWNCRRVLWGPSDIKYTPEQLQAAEDWFYAPIDTGGKGGFGGKGGHGGPPSDPPEGSTNQGGPFIVETWFEVPHYLDKARVPERPTASNVLIDGKWHAALVYDYVETKNASDMNDIGEP